jgi:hypothetical protein
VTSLNRLWSLSVVCRFWTGIYPPDKCSSDDDSAGQSMTGMGLCTGRGVNKCCLWLCRELFLHRLNIHRRRRDPGWNLDLRFIIDADANMLLVLTIPTGPWNLVERRITSMDTTGQGVVKTTSEKRLLNETTTTAVLFERDHDVSNQSTVPETNDHRCLCSSFICAVYFRL